MTASVKIRALNAKRYTNLSLTLARWTYCAWKQDFLLQSSVNPPKGCQDNEAWQFYSSDAINHPKGALYQPTRSNYLDSWLTGIKLPPVGSTDSQL